uniref:Uncharacterized protein n=1 Tax=Noctiluca scintillans TaxID=2966 RepID=A0A7S1AFK3_NOCSC|mmetsp:Transcript_44162/g.116909  ORF Transcript_44162/g.116909 Transcript_44162/m.116909 type:complete len:495 (+) Transcript_44162:221-1705(+)
MAVLVASIFVRRLAVFSAAALLSVTVEVGYAQLVPKLPWHYATMLRAAVWDCILIVVFAAQVVDLVDPVLAEADGGHYFPLAVLLYYTLKFLLCAVSDLLGRCSAARSRSRHRILIRQRILVDLAGGPSGAQMFLGRICFITSAAGIALFVHGLLLVCSEANALALSIVVMLASHCAAALAALDPRRTMPGKMVQWLCTGWSGRAAILTGPIKILGASFLLPFAGSIIVAQLWFRTVTFLVWLLVGCPCCRLRQGDSVYDAFEREVLLPLLQCSFLGFACALAALVRNYRDIDMNVRVFVTTAAVYHTGMLMLWATPAALKAKVADEEGINADYGELSGMTEDGQTQLLDQESGHGGKGEVELESMHATCQELRARLHRERHDKSIEVERLSAKLQDTELFLRASDRKLQDALRVAEGLMEENAKLTEQMSEWRGCYVKLAQEVGEGHHVSRPSVEGDSDVPIADCEEGDVGSGLCCADSTACLDSEQESQCDH